MTARNENVNTDTNIRITTGTEIYYTVSNINNPMLLSICAIPKEYEYL